MQREYITILHGEQSLVRHIEVSLYYSQEQWNRFLLISQFLLEKYCRVQLAYRTKQTKKYLLAYKCCFPWKENDLGWQKQSNSIPFSAVGWFQFNWQKMDLVNSPTYQTWVWFWYNFRTLECLSSYAQCLLWVFFSLI